eukprot:TRINITY_DN1665_c0_g1_i1.p1 TRINITY_DN1665_c0_g1~~TRINITY_DN1665_c0_g1_i1.p1  ORF type:complete len:1402 (-),score=244.40 TRINITY_DN1665_c0_g1_i1:1801-6006(-)
MLYRRPLLSSDKLMHIPSSVCSYRVHTYLKPYGQYKKTISSIPTNGSSKVVTWSSVIVQGTFFSFMRRFFRSSSSARLKQGRTFKGLGPIDEVLNFLQLKVALSGVSQVTIAFPELYPSLFFIKLIVFISPATENRSFILASSQSFGRFSTQIDVFLSNGSEYGRWTQRKSGVIPCLKKNFSIIIAINIVNNVIKGKNSQVYVIEQQQQEKQQIQSPHIIPILMGKKKVELLFKVDLAFDDKAKITKSALKNYMESKIKGLRITTYDVFTIVKDVVRAEVASNVITLLPAEDLIKEQGKNMFPEEHEEAKEGTIAEKLLERIRVLMATYNDKSKKKTVTEHLDKFLDALENRAMEVCDVFAKIHKENQQLKAGLDSVKQMQTTSITQVSRSLTEAQMDQTASFLKNLEAENAKLRERVVECEDKLKMYEKNVGDKVLMDRITDLEKQLKGFQSVHESEMKEQEDKCRMLSLQILEGTDRIKELEDQLKDENKGDIVNAKKVAENLNEKLKELEAKLMNSEAEVSQLKSKLNIKEEANRQLTNDLAKSLDTSSKLEERVNALQKEFESDSKRVSLLPIATSSIGLDSGFSSEKSKDLEVLEERKKVDSELFPQQSTQLTSSGIAASEDYDKSLKRLSDVESELKIKNNKLSHLTAFLSAKEEEIVKAMDDYKQLQEQLKETQEEVNKTQAQLESAISKKEALQEKVAVLDANMFELNMQNTTHKDRLEKAQELLGRKEEEKVKLLRMIEERNQVIRDNEDRYIEYEQNKEELEKIIMNLQGKLQSAGIKVQGGDLLNAKLEEYKKRIKELESENRVKSDKIQKLEAMSAESAKMVEELKAKVRDLEEGNENLKRLLETKNVDSPKTSVGIEDGMEQLKIKLVRVEEESKVRTTEAKVKLEMELEVAKRDKEEAEKTAEKAKNSLNDLQIKLKEAEKAFNEKSAEIKRLEAENSNLQLSLEESKRKQEEEQNSLKLQILALETQAINKAPISSDKSVGDLQNEIKTLRRQQIEQRQLMINEQLRIQKELGKCQETARQQNKQLYEKDMEIIKRTEEIKRLTNFLQESKEKAEELQGMCESKTKECEELRSKLLEVKLSEAQINEKQGTGREKATAAEVEEYLKEIVYLYKTLTSTSKERIEEKKLKIQNIKTLENVMSQMYDKKITKEKLKTIVISSLHLFPYLAKFDLKSDYKFIVMGIVKIIEHKKEKLPGYETECERNRIVFECAEKGLQTYNEKLRMLLSKHKQCITFKLQQCILSIHNRHLANNYIILIMVEANFGGNVATLLIAILEYEEYVIKEHDTVATISLLKNISPETLVKVNKLSGGLHPGQVLKIPKTKAAADKDASAQREISDAGNITSVAASKELSKAAIENYQNIRKAKGEKDIVVSDLREKLLTESS